MREELRRRLPNSEGSADTAPVTRAEMRAALSAQKADYEVQAGALGLDERPAYRPPIRRRLPLS